MENSKSFFLKRKYFKMLIIIKDVIYKKIKKFFSLTFFLIVIMIFQCETAYHHSTLKNQQAKKMRENVLLDRN